MSALTWTLPVSENDFRSALTWTLTVSENDFRECIADVVDKIGCTKAANLLHCHKSTISRWARGVSCPNDLDRVFFLVAIECGMEDT